MFDIVDGSAHGRGGTTVGNKDDEALVNLCCGEIDKRKQAINSKVTGKVFPSGRMASVGRYVTGCRVRVKSDFCL